MRACDVVSPQPYIHDAWGNEADEPSEVNDYRYSGQWDYSTHEKTVWQPDPVNNYRTGLMHLGCRFYDPELGRFIQPDPLLGNPYNPQSLNRYTYCANSPLSRIDSLGAKDKSNKGGFWSKVRTYGGLFIAGVGGAIREAGKKSGSSAVTKVGTYVGIAGVGLAAVGIYCQYKDAEKKVEGIQDDFGDKVDDMIEDVRNDGTGYDGGLIESLEHLKQGYRVREDDD